MEHGNDTVNKPRDSRKSMDKKVQDGSAEKLMEDEKINLIDAVKKYFIGNNISISKVSKELQSRSTQKQFKYGSIPSEYEEIFNELIENLKGSIEVEKDIEKFFNNMNPPFSYYYNLKKINKFLQDGIVSLDDKNNTEEIVKHISEHLKSRLWKPHSDDNIIDTIKLVENIINDAQIKIDKINSGVYGFRNDNWENYSSTTDISRVNLFIEEIMPNLEDSNGIFNYEYLRVFIAAFHDGRDSKKNKYEIDEELKKYEIMGNSSIQDVKKGLKYYLSDRAHKYQANYQLSNLNLDDVFRYLEQENLEEDLSLEKEELEFTTIEPIINTPTVQKSTQISESPQILESPQVSKSTLVSKSNNRLGEIPKLTVLKVKKIYELCQEENINDIDINNIFEICDFLTFKTMCDLVFNKLKIKYENTSLKNPIKNLKLIMLKSLEYYKEVSQYGIHMNLKYNKQVNDSEYLLYATSIGDIDIDSLEDLVEFKLTVRGEKETKYTARYNEFLTKMEEKEDEIIMECVTQSLTSRYEAAAAVAEGRNFYESDIIDFTVPITEDQPQSGLQVASNIDNVDDKLNHYGFKSNKTEHEEAALKYTAFDITFKNTFNLTNPIIEKLGAQQVNLRDDLFKYGIYNQDSNTFNQSARDKYVAEKLEPIGLTSLDIEELWKTMAGLPDEVEKNYEILSGNFNTDQDNFEKIAKIYALGEIIDNIKNLFENGEVFSDNAKLGNIMGFELDETKPADIVGDCLLLKGKVNGTETKIKYDLRTGKLYMNALTQQEFNPPKITIGNDEPNTEIGDLGNFDNLLEGYQPTSFTQTDNVDYSKSSNENATIDENGDIINSDSSNKEGNDAENKDSNQKTLEKLMENKLLEKLAIIGNTVREKAGEQSKENNVIDEFLRTFNILPDEGNSDTIEFLGGSNLYILLESIKNTNDEDYLLKFSKLMSELMSFCGLTRGKNNLSPKEPDFDSVTIFNIDEKNATQDIISLQKANQSFFSDTDGEKDRIKGCKCHFDSSVKLSFANIIVQKCCRRYGEGWKISANHAQEFVDSVKKGIEDIKHDENDVVAMENMIEDESMWA